MSYFGIKVGASFCTFSVLEMADSDSDEFSDEEFYNPLRFDLDFAEINEEQRRKSGWSSVRSPRR